LRPRCIDRGLAARHVEFHENGRHVILNRALRDEQFICDLRVRETLSEEFENLSLSYGQSSCVLSGRS